MARLINDILDFQKLEAGKMELDITENDMAHIINEVCATMLPLAEQKGLLLACAAEKGLPPLRFDKDRIEQVLINLLSNAIKFTERGEITIIIENSHNGTITTRIRGTGIGIPQDELEKIFDRFYQIHRPLVEKSRGAGLGLAISNSLIEMHGGSITVESQEGSGSEFSFTLPLQGTG